MTWLALGEYRGPRSARAFARYLVARYEERAFEGVFRDYVADSLKAYLSLSVRYHDIIHPAPDFDAEEVVKDVIARAGLEVRNEPARPDGEDIGRRPGVVEDIQDQ